MTLKLDWCTHEAAKYACEHWHYTKSIPTPPLAKIGVWENGQFIGVVLFGRGASNNLLKPYGLAVTEGAELVRVALRFHQTPVSRILSISLKLVKARYPSMRLIVSHADANQDHHGGIYQACNWVYTGTTSKDYAYIDKSGRRWHSRMVSPNGIKTVYGVKRAVVKPQDCQRVLLIGKHRYLFPMDKEMAQHIAPLSRPYPKRARSTDSGAPSDQLGGGGAKPTRALISEGTENNGE